MSRDKNRPRVILAMDTDEGITGWGECYNHGPDKALFPLFDYLVTFLRGQDPRRIEFLIHYLMQQTRFPPGALGRCVAKMTCMPAARAFCARRATLASTSLPCCIMRSANSSTTITMEGNVSGSS